MKRKNLLPAALLIITCVMTQFEAAPLTPTAPPKGKGRLVGVLLDVNDARVAGAAVTIRNKDFVRRVVSGQAGEFEVELPVAKYPYWFTVEANGFCNFEGELLRVRPGATEMINIHLEVMATHSGCNCYPKPK